VGMAAVAAGHGHYETAARLRGAARAAGYPPVISDEHIDARLERDYFRARARTIRPSRMAPCSSRRRGTRLPTSGRQRAKRTDAPHIAKPGADLGSEHSKPPFSAHTCGV
jgi:hypothetical protein